MLTAALVTLIQEEVGAAWSRAKILDALNRAQNDLLGGDCQLKRVKPDPFLTTVSGTYTYTPATSLYDSSLGTKGALVGDVRAVRDIYIDVTNMATLDQLALNTSFVRTVDAEFRPRDNRIHLIFDETDSIGPSLSDCVVKWPALYNPGATTITWKAEAYLWPDQLLTENIALDIPEDFQESLLLQHVLKGIQRREFGSGTDALREYYTTRSAFRLKYSKMKTQDGDMIAIPRPC